MSHNRDISQIMFVLICFVQAKVASVRGYLFREDWHNVLSVVPQQDQAQVKLH